MSTKEPQQDVNVGNVVPTKTAASGDEAAEEAVTPKVPQVDETLIRGRLALGPRPGVPKWIAWGVLVFAMLSSAIFLVGQITAMWGLGGAVSVELSNGQVLTMSSVPFEMSLFFSLKACIETGLVPEVILGVILFFFSGIWPHAKLLLMLYCWFGNMSHRFRQIVLYWIGSFGKFSFADPLSELMRMRMIWTTLEKMASHIQESVPALYFNLRFFLKLWLCLWSHLPCRFPLDPRIFFSMPPPS